MPKAMARAAGKIEGTRVRNAVVITAITDANNKDSPPGVDNHRYLLIGVELITYTFNCRDVAITDFLSYFSDVYIHCSGEHIHVSTPDVL